MWALPSATLSHRMIVLCLGAVMPGCGDETIPEEPAAPPKAARAPVEDSTNAVKAQREAALRAAALTDRNGNPIRMIDARSIKIPGAQFDRSSQFLNVPLDQPVIHRTAAGEPEADGWCVAESTWGSFSVSLPGKFSDSAVKSRTPTGGAGLLHTIAWKGEDGAEFNVLETEVFGQRPQSQRDSVQQMIDGYEKVGAAVTRKDAKLAGVNADRLSVEANGVHAEIILATISNRGYMLGAQWRSSAAPGLLDDAERFFASFKMK